MKTRLEGDSEESGIGEEQISVIDRCTHYDSLAQLTISVIFFEGVEDARG